MTGDQMTAPISEISTEQSPAPRRRTWLRFAVAFLVGLVAAMAIGAGALYAFDRHYTDRIVPGVRIGGVDVSGLTPAEARTTLNSAFASFSTGRAVLSNGDRQLPIAYADVDRRPDVDAMVSDALAVGRSGQPIERMLSNARTAIHGVDLPPRVTFDKARLTGYIETFAAMIGIDPTDASVAASKDGFAVVEGVEGRVADKLGPTDQLTATLSRTDAPSDLAVPVQLASVEPGITTAEAATAKAAADRIALDVKLVDGDESWTIAAATVRSWITFETGAGGTHQPVVDETRIDAALAVVGKSVARSTKNASFVVSGGKITGVTASRNGRKLDAVVTHGRIATLLATRASGGPDATVEPALIVTNPSLTTEEATAAQPNMVRISSWTTYFPISERNHFGANIWLPALAIDGTVVAPGEMFDFWKAVGTISTANGYGAGGAIINGKTEPQGALAGGICSCSTTLFNAALRAGFDMKARRNHFYYIDRYPIGLDATVFISASGSKQTMSWVNDTAYPVLIRGYKIRSGTRGYVRFEIYSVPNGRTVDIGTPTIKNVRPPSDRIQYTTTLAPGVHQRVEYPVAGKDVWRTVTVRENGEIIHQTTYYSHYSRVDGLTLIGQ
jgi:vancomycin resistance protein YoaR